MELAMKKLEKIVNQLEYTVRKPLKNLQDMLIIRMNNLAGFNFLKK